MNNEPELVACSPEICEQVFGPILEVLNETIDFRDCIELFSKDIRFCAENLGKSPQDQFWRRNLVRIVFALLETFTCGLKRIALKQHAIYEVNFSAAEVALLGEYAFLLDEQGEAVTQDNNFQRLVPSLRFALKCFSKAHGITFSLDFSEVPLTESERVRNRITRPKELSDFTMTDDEIEKVEAVGNWVIKVVFELMTKGVDRSLRARMPQVNATTNWNVTHDYIVMEPNGNVYQFKTLEEAEAYRNADFNECVPFQNPLVFCTKDLRQGPYAPTEQNA